MKKLTIVLFLLTLSASVFADEASVFSKYPNAAGGFYGNAAGQGLSWQHWFSEFGMAVSGGFMYNGGSYADANIGIEGQYMFDNFAIENWFEGNFYLFLAANIGGSFGAASNSVSIYPGIGIGTEFVFAEHFSLPLEFGYGASWTLGDAVPMNGGPLLQAGFRYRF